MNVPLAEFRSVDLVRMPRLVVFDDHAVVRWRRGGHLVEDRILLRDVEACDLVPMGETFVLVLRDHGRRALSIPLMEGDEARRAKELIESLLRVREPEAL